MRARYYTAVHGRFWSPDPEGFAGKSPNLYVYADNKPTDIIDPRGTFLLPVIAAGAVIGETSSVVCRMQKQSDGPMCAKVF